jgi:hypothetical protein
MSGRGNIPEFPGGVLTGASADETVGGMAVYTDRPAHTRPTFQRPTFTRASAADPYARHHGALRSGLCGHVIGLAVVRNGRQWVLQWAVCR